TTVFGRAPPTDLWPPAKERFASFPHQRWVDLRKHTLTSRRTLALIGAGLFFGGLALGWSLGRF
ncbi:MAG: hypothetical protein ACPIFP_08510, partial [Candidatus Poseidoniaceae archaeon]